MQPRNALYTLMALCILASCAHKTDTAFGRGSPESLIDVSSEIVNLGVNSSSEVDALSQWINRDQPTRAEIYCTESSALCKQAKQALNLYGVPTSVVPSGSNMVTLVYERVVARDCKQRYVDKLYEYTNAHHPAFGCSIAANIVQHVTNKQEFISPNIADARDAESASNSYNTYQRSAASSETSDISLDDSTLSKARTE